MPENRARKYTQVVNYVEDQIGADIDRDLLKIAIGAQDIANLDVATALDAATASTGDDELRTRLLGEDSGGSLREVDAEQLDTGVSGTAVAQLTYLARALNSQDLDEFITRVTDSGGSQIDPLNQDALEAVANDELRSRLHDSTGTQIDPGRAVDFPNQQVTAQDLSAGDVTIGPFPVEKSEALVVAVNETTGGTLDVTVNWVDGNGNTFQSEGPSVTGLNDVTEDWSRLVRKGPQAEVVLSNVSSATFTNAHVDTEK